MKVNFKREKGITLVALVITIVILLILAGISIAALTQTGLFEKANKAEQKSKEKQEEENVTLETYENEMGKYLEGNSNTEIKLADKVNDGTIKIGNYIKYIPDIVTNDDKSYTDLISNLKTYSGSTSNTTSTLIQEINKDTGLNWRVLDITDDGQVRLISDKSTTSKITFGMYNGYNNAVKLLDDTCNILYNNSKLVSKVQNVKIEDIQEKIIEKDYSKIDSSYGKTSSPSSKYYPNIFLKERDQTVNGTTLNELGQSEQKELIAQTTKPYANSWTLKYTYWTKEMNETDFTDPIYYKLFMNNGQDSPAYWISSRCVRLWSNYVNFCIRFVNNGVYTYSVYSSYGDVASTSYAFRPIVTLKSNVLIDLENSGNGSTAEQGYAIK